MKTNKIELVATDLDGTLLKTNQSISKEDINTLKSLGKQNIYRIIATGRSVYSVNKILNKDFPIDYLIFSSGAGILEWKSKKIILSYHLTKDKVAAIAKLLITQQIDFMIHEPIPDNHRFVYYKNEKNNPDFINRCELYKDFCSPIKYKNANFKEACQIIAIIPEDILLFEKTKYKINHKIKNIKIIRTTSPLDGKSIWIEIFPLEVSKGNAVKYLCKILKINSSHTLGIGNDYNDLDLLHWTTHSYVVANAPIYLKNKFDVSESNLNSGFTKAVKKKISFID